MRASVCNYILRWVENNICSGNGINELVLSTGYSRKTIELWFQKTYKMSLYSYLLKRRMTFAATLLKLTSISVTEIAYILNYSSHQNFCRAFKKYTSRTPTEYRREDGWDFSIMQWTLIYSNEKETTYTFNKIKEQYFSGEDFIVADNLHQSGGRRISCNIKEVVKGFWSKNKSDVIVLFDMKDKPNRGLINIENYNESDFYIRLKVGVLKESYTEGDMIIPKGDYLNYVFSGSWNDYLCYSRPLYVKIMSEIKAKLKNAPIYVRFLYKEDNQYNKNDHIECEIYSPINKVK
ncbi:helix-turn-helix transcriptional regulator [Escherichia coli]|nr:helix-turn-helix transcriptional regulator [Escherichia coli]EFT0847870.1 helix-turn-helix transcriptional regulator [Escherichia coli]EMD6874491.1 helix-turn-helix transcriptional regulator [Escherichia coli]